jgi:glycosyltransferase involved in cell wall biosynthesis
VLSSLKARLRPPLSAGLWPLVKPFWRSLDVGRDGRPLQPGITAVVAARDEAFTIGLCLRSLVGFADQIVCVDNGSEDGTLAEMHSFREAFAGRVETDIVSLPGALLGECREAGLAATRRQWHLRWDADMVAKTSGPANVRDLRQRVLADDRPRSIQLARTNLYGDLEHVLRHHEVVDPGEPILVRFGRGIEYREFGRFDTIRMPLYYAQQRDERRYYFHLAGLKSDNNLLHRFHYFSWRERVNREGAALDPELRTLDGYKRRMNAELFGTNEPCALKFRFRKQLSYLLEKYRPEEYGEYPEVLETERARPGRFEVLYRDGRPFTRVDRHDEEMLQYEPTREDMEWDAETFLRRFLNSEQCRRVGIRPRP